MQAVMNVRRTHANAHRSPRRCTRLSGSGIRIPGPETARLAEFARQCDVHVCAMVFEYDPDWPLRYFNTAIIIAPSGEIVLRYRKLQCADLNGLLNVTTPGNVASV